jgi:hypothetical protein
MWPKYNHIAVFDLDLKSTYEGEQTIFDLSLADLTQNNVLQFHHWFANGKISFFFLAK